MFILAMTSELDKLEFDFTQFIKEDTKMSIIMILKTYGSLNLRQISTVIGISEPSTHAHIKELLKKRYIMLDVEMAGKRGKYYKINELLDEYLDQGEQEFESENHELYGGYYQRMAPVMRTLSIMTQRFGSYVANYIEENADTLNERREENLKQGLGPSAFVTGNLSFITVKNNEEIDEIFQAFQKFTEKVLEVNTRNADLKEADSHDIVMISSLLIPMFKLDPREN